MSSASFKNLVENLPFVSPDSDPHGGGGGEFQGQPEQLRIGLWLAFFRCSRNGLPLCRDSEPLRRVVERKVLLPALAVRLRGLGMGVMNSALRRASTVL
jgi:hypothetical protein